jgi:hypothetical protein
MGGGRLSEGDIFSCVNMLKLDDQIPLNDS